PGVAERSARSEHAVVEALARRDVAAGAEATRRIDAARLARDGRLDRHPVPDRDAGTGAGLDDDPRDLVAEHDGDRHGAREGRRRSARGAEDVKVAAAD